MKRLFILWSCALCWLGLNGCSQQRTPSAATPTTDTTAAWVTTLQERLPLLGHRNWIVITDMAYPLQANPSIETLYSGESYERTLATVWEAVARQPHIAAHVYQDLESQRLTEAVRPGIEDYRSETARLLGQGTVSYRPHEELILHLDSVSRLYRVVIVKSRSTLPYTTTFLELDCKYWNAAQAAAAGL